MYDNGQGVPQDYVNKRICGWTLQASQFWLRSKKNVITRSSTAI